MCVCVCYIGHDESKDEYDADFSGPKGEAVYILHSTGHEVRWMHVCVCVCVHVCE